MGVKIENKNVIALRIGNTPIVKRYINGSIVYRSVVPEVTDYDILAVYNVDDTSSATRILSNINHVEYAYLNDRPIDVAMDYAFAQSGTYTLKVKLQDKIDNVPSYSFKSCNNLVSVDISARLTVLGTEAFHGCTNLTSVTLPDTLTAIYADAFYNCNSLTSIEIPTTVTEIGSSAFKNCSRLTSIVIPEGVTTIEPDTFNSCHRLRNVVIPSSVTSIGAMAFAGCRYLPSIIIPENVTSIGESAFYYCPELIQITCNATSAPILGTGALSALSNANDGVLYYPCGSDYSSWMTQLNQNPAVWTSECIKGELEYNVTMTCNQTAASGDIYFLNDVSRVEKMEIDGVEVTPVGNKTFDSGIHTIKVKFIDNDIPSSTLYNIDTIDISEDIETIETGAFQLANKLTSVTVSSYNKYYTAQGNCVMELLTGKMIAGVGEFTIPEDVTSIGMRSAWNNDFITEISIPDSVTTIEDGAFSDCSNLSSVTIGSGVTSVGDSVFTRCSNLSTITCNATTAPTINGYLDEWVSYGGFSIAEVGTFNYPCGSDYSTWLAQLPSEWVDGCSNEEPSYDVTATVVVTSTTSTTALAKTTSGMSAMYIDGVEVAPTSAYTFSTTGEHTVGYNFTTTSLASNVYSGCSTITEIVIGDRITSLASGNAALMVIQGTFGNMPSLEKVTIGNGITSLSATYGGLASKGAVSAFGNCPSLVEINLGESITAITGPVFMGCEHLSSITIPSRVTALTDYSYSGGTYGCFQGCTSLKEVTFEGTTAPSIDEHTFPNGNAGTFYYPCGSDYSAVASQLSTWTDGCGATPVEYDIDIEYSQLDNNGQSRFVLNGTEYSFTDTHVQVNLADLGVDEVTSLNFSMTNLNKVNHLPDLSNIENANIMFNGTQITELPSDIVWPSRAISCHSMFAYCPITKILVTPQVSSAEGMFMSTSLETARIDKSFANCSNFTAAFASCQNLKQVDFTVEVSPTKTSSMFYGCSALTEFKTLINLKLNEVTNASSMFENSSVTPQMLSELGKNARFGNKLTNASSMFKGCSSFNPTECTLTVYPNLFNLFYDCSYLDNVSHIFEQCGLSGSYNAAIHMNPFQISVSDVSYAMAQTQVQVADFLYLENLRTTQCMFLACSQLDHVYFTSLYGTFENTQGMFGGCGNMRSVDGVGMSNTDCVAYQAIENALADADISTTIYADNPCVSYFDITATYALDYGQEVKLYDELYDIEKMWVNGEEVSPSQYYYLDEGENTIQFQLSTSSVGSYAFYNLQELKTLDFGERITAINSDAIGYCDQLASITFNYDSYLGSRFAGEGCGNLTAIYWKSNSGPGVEDDTFTQLPYSNGTFYYPCGSDFSYVAEMLPETWQMDCFEA